MSEPPNTQGVAPDRAPMCESCGVPAAHAHYCRRHDAELCRGCVWARLDGCGAWREEEVEVDADAELLKGSRRLSERMRAFAVERETAEAQGRLSRRVNVAVLAVVAGLAALVLAMAMGYVG